MAQTSLEVTVEIHAEQLSDGQEVYVAECMELGIASQGDTVEKATENVTEALKLWLETASAKEIDNSLIALRRNRSKQFTTRIEVPYGQITGSVGCWSNG